MRTKHLLGVSAIATLLLVAAVAPAAAQPVPEAPIPQAAETAQAAPWSPHPRTAASPAGTW